MNKLIKKLTTWLLVFGMTFTPVLTSINVIAANAEEGGEPTITASEGEDGEDGQGEDGQGEVEEKPEPSQDVQEVLDAADAAATEEAVLDEKVEAVDAAVGQVVEDGLATNFFFDPITGANNSLKTWAGVADLLVGAADDQSEVIASDEGEIKKTLEKAAGKANDAEQIAEDINDELDKTAATISSLNKQIQDADTIEDAEAAYGKAVNARNTAVADHKQAVSDFNQTLDDYDELVASLPGLQKKYFDAVATGSAEAAAAKIALDQAYAAAESLEKQAEARKNAALFNYGSKVQFAESAVVGAQMTYGIAVGNVVRATGELALAKRSEASALAAYNNAKKAEKDALLRRDRL